MSDKRCAHCQQIKRYREFGYCKKTRDHCQNYCKDCVRLDGRARALGKRLSECKPEELLSKKEKMVRRTEKRCGTCAITKPISEFYAKGRYHASECKLCSHKRGRAHRINRDADPKKYAKHRAKANARTRAYRQRYPEKTAVQRRASVGKWIKTHPEEAKAMRERFKEAHPNYWREYAAMRLVEEDTGLQLIQKRDPRRFVCPCGRECRGNAGWTRHSSACEVYLETQTAPTITTWDAAA